MNEKENTFRRLNDEALLVKSVWCSFGWHRWTQYGAPKVRTEGVYTVDYQVRKCASCNVYDTKTLRRY